MIDQVYDQISDEELALQAAGGCDASFEQLVQRFQVPLVHFLSRRTGSREDAEDISQEAFVRAYANLARYRPQWRFSTWLFTIARRLCINHLRRQSVQQESRSASIDSVGEMQGRANEPQTMLSSREQRQRLWSQVADVLSEPKFTALWLFYVEEMPVLEISRVLGRSRVAVKTMMFRARQELVPILQDSELLDGRLLPADFEPSFVERLKSKLLAPGPLLAKNSA
jgi:RNA polymerase sigma-70 factor (ECF subfamily)